MVLTFRSVDGVPCYVNMETVVSVEVWNEPPQIFPGMTIHLNTRPHITIVTNDDRVWSVHLDDAYEVVQFFSRYYGQLPASGKPIFEL